MRERAQPNAAAASAPPPWEGERGGGAGRGCSSAPAPSRLGSALCQRHGAGRAVWFLMRGGRRM